MEQEESRDQDLNPGAVFCVSLCVAGALKSISQQFRASCKFRPIPEAKPHASVARTHRARGPYPPRRSLQMTFTKTKSLYRRTSIAKISNLQSH